MPSSHSFSVASQLASCDAQAWSYFHCYVQLATNCALDYRHTFFADLGSITIADINGHLQCFSERFSCSDTIAFQ